jgi:dihydrofolate reductase
VRQLIYYVACTVDGFIAGPDGSFDFALSEGEHLTDLAQSFPETFSTHLRGAFNISGANRRFDTVLMGRKTYQIGLDAGFTSPYAHLRQYVFSRTLTTSPDPDVELIHTDPLPFVAELKCQPGLNIWLCGGAQLAAALFPLIDELVLKVNPVLIGSGIPLFSNGMGQARLTLLSTKTYPNGFMMSRYCLSE